MIKLGLVGKGISHSRSQSMYEELLGRKVDYGLLDYETPKDIESLGELFDKGFQGISVTYPYKAHYLKDTIIEDEEVFKLSAINCIRKRGNLYEATNTDFLAVGSLLVKDFSHFKSFIVLGSGNMARVFKAQFEKLNLNYVTYSRKKFGDLNKLNFINIIKELDKNTMVINCCSRDFVFTAKLPDQSYFWDMNYSFKDHDSLKTRPINYIEGLNLLKWQAKFALQFWKIT